jgi:hypothetical protein
LTTMQIASAQKYAMIFVAQQGRAMKPHCLGKVVTAAAPHQAHYHHHHHHRHPYRKHNDLHQSRATAQMLLMIELLIVTSPSRRGRRLKSRSMMTASATTCANRLLVKRHSLRHQCPLQAQARGPCRTMSREARSSHVVEPSMMEEAGIARWWKRTQLKP